jgi:hypothetical protein
VNTLLYVPWHFEVTNAVKATGMNFGSLMDAGQLTQIQEICIAAKEIP